MKLVKLSVLAAFAAMLVMGLTGSAFAFHDGGVANCDGCHTMHNSYKGAKMSVTGTVLVGNQYLLKGSDPSSTCLSCHGKGTTLSGYHVATGVDTGYTGATLPAQRTPGGDFSWLKVSYNSTTGTFGPSANMALNRLGHHVVAADYSYGANTDNGGLAPGGTYPSASLSCISCHNPHNKTRADGSSLPISASGSYGDTAAAGTALGTYRFLGGIGYLDPQNGYTFSQANAPVAVAPHTYNQSESINQVRVAYGQGMSEWCANCHSGIYNPDPAATTTHRHVASNGAILNQLMPDGVTNAATVYNAYVNTGNTTGGSQASAYLSLVPYELGTSDNTTLLSYAQGGTQTGANAAAGPSLGTENVMCLSCHRAHASGFDSMARYDVKQTIITDDAGAWSYTSSVTREPTADASGYFKAANYDRPDNSFGPVQRMLCNKCHAKD